jgi:hypothetical protein
MYHLIATAQERNALNVNRHNVSKLFIGSNIRLMAGGRVAKYVAKQSGKPRSSRQSVVSATKRM